MATVSQEQGSYLNIKSTDKKCDLMTIERLVEEYIEKHQMKYLENFAEKHLEKITENYQEKCLDKDLEKLLENHLERHLEKYLKKYLNGYLEKYQEMYVEKHLQKYKDKYLKKLEKEFRSEITQLKVKDGFEKYGKENIFKNYFTGSGVMRGHISEFWSHFTMPGLKYIGNNGFHLVDRFLWLMVLLFSVAISFHCIHSSYLKWRSSPVLLSFNDSMTHIKAVPFPAVTVCPGRQLSKTFISDELTGIECSARDCSVDLPLTSDTIAVGGLLCPEFAMLQREDKYMNGTIDKLIRQYSSTCVDDTTWFKWNGDDYRHFEACKSHFQTLFLCGRVCYTFNMLPARVLFHENVIPPMVDETELETKPNWTLDNMLQLADLSQTVPQYISSNGPWEGLYFSFQKNVTKDDLCRQLNMTPQIVFHHPGEIPIDETHKFYNIPEAEDVFYKLTPQLLTFSQELLGYAPEDRKCFYSDEIKLSFFRSYSQQNCRLECRINCTLRVCDCVPFYFPRFNDSKICGIQHTKKCAEYIIPALLGGRYTWKEIVEKSWKDLGGRIQNLFQNYRYETLRGPLNITEDIIQETYPDCRCNCPTACSSLGYNVEIVPGAQKHGGRVTIYRREPFWGTRLAVSFKELEFTSIVRKELIGLTDFIADSGGVLGVFTGFTFLAVIEMLFFMTLRLWKNIKRSWDGQEKVVNEEGGGSYSLHIIDSSS